MEVKPLNSMGSLQPWLQVVRAVNPSASSQVTRKPCFEYDSVLLFENSSIDRVVPLVSFFPSTVSAWSRRMRADPGVLLPVRLPD